MESDTFTQKYIALIKEAKTDDDLAIVIDAIYTDGFTDGANEGRDDGEETKASKEGKKHE